jgi:hypothetical protein
MNASTRPVTSNATTGSKLSVPHSTAVIEAFDTEKFIAEVECRPAIWDMSCDEYSAVQEKCCHYRFYCISTLKLAVVGGDL